MYMPLDKELGISYIWPGKLPKNTLARNSIVEKRHTQAIIGCNGKTVNQIFSKHCFSDVLPRQFLKSLFYVFFSFK